MTSNVTAITFLQLFFCLQSVQVSGGSITKSVLSELGAKVKVELEPLKMLTRNRKEFLLYAK